MRIGFFTDTFEPSLNGVVTSIESFASELRRHGCSVTVIAPRDARGPTVSAPTSVPVHWVPSLPFILERNHQLALPVQRRVMRIVEDERLDVIHTQTPFTIGYAGIRAAGTFGIPLVHTYHTYYAQYAHYLRAGARVGRRLVPPISRWFCNLHDLVLAPSTDILGVLREYGVRKPIEVLMSGVDVPELKHGGHDTARLQLDIPSDARILLFVGRLAQEKNIDLLFEAMLRLRRDDPRAVLCLVGDGPDRMRLEGRRRELGLLQNVRIVGRIPHDELSPWFEAADLFVNPSTTETQGLALLEAMAHALPAVAAAGPGTRDLIRSGENGLIVDPEPARLANGMSSLLNDPALSAKLGRAARRTAESLDMSAQASRLLGHYENLRERCGRRARRGVRGLAAAAWEEAVAWK